VAGNGSGIVLQAGEAGGDRAPDGDAPQRRDAELRRMAAFRIRETANRIVVLANSARNERLREELLAICQMLQREEQALLDGIDA
jgi:hypothetical protein